MSGNFAIKGGGVRRLMANAILNFHFDFPHTSLIVFPQTSGSSWRKMTHLLSPVLQIEAKHIFLKRSLEICK